MAIDANRMTFEVATTATKPRLSHRVKTLFPPGQVLRYLVVGVCNTIIGYGLYAATLFLLTRATPGRYLYLTAVAASLVSTPLAITVSYFNYKLFVFRTRGNHLREWLKAFGVYGVSMLPGLIALSAFTRLLQTLLHGHAPFGKGTAGYIAGALTTGFSTIISFIGHRKITFKPKADINL
jgi:putative flippase GtrA